MPEQIVKRSKGWAVVTPDGRVLGTHDTYGQAVAQKRAVALSKARAAGYDVPDSPNPRPRKTVGGHGPPTRREFHALESDVKHVKLETARLKTYTGGLVNAVRALHKKPPLRAPLQTDARASLSGASSRKRRPNRR